MFGAQTLETVQLVRRGICMDLESHRFATKQSGQATTDATYTWHCIQTLW